MDYRRGAPNNQPMGMHLPYRRLAHAAEWSLLAAVVLVHVAAWIWREQLASGGPLGALLADSLPLASLILVSLWLGLGPGSPWLRGGVAVLAATIVATSIVWDGLDRWTPANWLLAVTPLGIFVCAALLRLCGLKVHRGRLDRASSAGATFTVRSLLALTTAIAIAVGGLEALRPWLHSRQSPAIIEVEPEVILSPVQISADGLQLTQNQTVLTVPASTPWRVVVRQLESAQQKGQIRMALAATLFIAMSLLAFTAILRPGAIWLRVAGLALLIPAAGWYIGHLTETDAESTKTLTLWAGTTAALVASSLLPLRLMGYRLARPCQQRSPVEAHS